MKAIKLKKNKFVFVGNMPKLLIIVTNGDYQRIVVLLFLKTKYQNKRIIENEINEKQQRKVNKLEKEK